MEQRKGEAKPARRKGVGREGEEVGREGGRGRFQLQQEQRLRVRWEQWERTWQEGARDLAEAEVAEAAATGWRKVRSGLWATEGEARNGEVVPLEQEGRECGGRPAVRLAMTPASARR
jgi:hypothetical protein